VSGPQATQTRPSIGKPNSIGPASAQGGSPHISVTREYLNDLINICRRNAQPEQERYSVGKLNPGATTQPPKIPITRSAINLHPNIDIDEAQTPVSEPISLAPGVSLLQAIAILRPELAPLTQAVSEGAV
jgi:hypothetical protein